MHIVKVFTDKKKTEYLLEITVACPFCSARTKVGDVLLYFTKRFMYKRFVLFVIGPKI